MAYATKDPEAKITVGHDWSTRLGTDTITASTWSATPTGLTLTGSAFTNTGTKSTSVWVEGGTDGTVYRLVNRVTMASTGIDEKTLRVLVQHA